MDYERVLGRLCALPGPSGFETQAVQGAAELLRPLVDEVYTTRLGSLVGVRRCGRFRPGRTMRRCLPESRKTKALL